MSRKYLCVGIPQLGIQLSYSASKELPMCTLHTLEMQGDIQRFFLENENKITIGLLPSEPFMLHAWYYHLIYTCFVNELGVTFVILLSPIHCSLLLYLLFFWYSTLIGPPTSVQYFYQWKYWQQFMWYAKTQFQ